jgi:branched-chain amino acid transport system permease protein
VAQIVVGGLAMGCIYALVSLGFLITYKSAGVLNFAYGEFMMLGAYFAITFYTKAHLPMWLTFLLVLAATGVLGVVFHYLVYAPLKGRSETTFIIGTIGLGIGLQSLALVVWGPFPYSLPPLGGAKPLNFLGVAMAPQNLFIFFTTAMLVTGLWWLYARTGLGWKMQAVAQDSEAATLQGVDTERVILLTWIVSTMVASVAGFLIAPLFFVSATMGFSVMLKAFIAAIIGGFGSLQGAIVGALGVGVAEALMAGYVSTQNKDILMFVLLILVLLFRPQGLFGEKIGEKV